MAVTTAKSPEQPKEKVYKGASGGAAPEGYKAGDNRPLDGVIERGAAGDHDRFVQANKFTEKVKQAQELKSSGDPKKIAKAQAKVQKEQEKLAEAKPTAAGASINALNNPATAQSAAETKKQEQAELLGGEAAKDQSEGNFSEAQDKVKKAEELKNGQKSN